MKDTNFCYYLDVPYEITVYTGDVSGAGTSANIFVVIYGAELNTGECVLAETKKKKKGCFERSSTDQFVKEVENTLFVTFDKLSFIPQMKFCQITRHSRDIYKGLN
jgi:hypothetical protein